MGLDPLEIGALVIVIVSALLGLKRGLFSEVFALAVWLLAFILATLFYPFVSELLVAHLGEYYSTLVGFVAISVAAIIIGGVIHLLIRILAFASHISAMSRLVGAVIAAVKGVIIVAWLVFIIASTPLQSADWFNNSSLTYQLGPLTSWLQGIVFSNQKPPQMKQFNMKHLNDLKSKLEQR